MEASVEVLMTTYIYRCERCNETMEIDHGSGASYDGQDHMLDVHGSLVQCGPLRRVFTPPNLVNMPTRSKRNEMDK